MKSTFLLSDAIRAFACFGQPSTYIDEDLYETERDEYEQMLGGKPRALLVATDFGTVSWGPLCQLTPAAMAYLLPRLMELAASDARDKSGELFMMRFINRFSDGPSGTEFSLLDINHRAVVAAYLEHLSSEHGELVKQEFWEDVLADGIRNWRDA